MRDGPKRRLDGSVLDLSALSEGAGADRVVAFAETFCRLTKGAEARQLVRLRPFQVEILRGLFDDPRPRRAYVQVARKNAKSTLAAIIALYALVADEEEGAEVYALAGDERQARVVWNIARRMVELSPELRAVIQIYKDRLVHEATDSVFEPLSAEADLRQGLNPSLVVLDEVHVQRDDRLWEAMSQAMGARRRPLLLGITTPGHDPESLARRLYDYGQEGGDAAFFFRAFEPRNPDCSVTDERAWAEANPALGDWLDPDDLRASARTTPEATFRRYRLGQWTAEVGAWLPAGTWEACADAAKVIPDGAEVVLGFDGSASGDSTALIGCTVEDRPHLFVLGHWENPGDPNWRVNRGEVDAAVAAAFDRYSVRRLAADPFGWRDAIERWAGTYGPTTVLEFPTNALQRMAPATDRLYVAVAEQALTHDGDARLARHVRNAHAKQTTHGAVVVKERRNSTRRIDLAVAAIVAHDSARALPPTRRSRRLLTF